MVRSNERIPGGAFSSETPSFDEMMFGSYEGVGFFDEEEEQSENSDDHVNKNKAFWESQQDLLQTTLYRTSSIELKIRQATEEALRESNLEGIKCTCPRPIQGGCRSCLLKEISGRLQQAGFNSAICKSKWRSSADIPSGEHTYIDVVHKSSTNQMEVRVVVELKFRAEFEMARASEEYKALIDRLPEFYVGKAERLRNLIKILCTAAKKCMKEKNMHMGPWRKHKYMQAKWFGSHERSISEPACQSKSPSSLQRLKKPRSSLLTSDLLDKMNSGVSHFTAVEVV